MTEYVYVDCPDCGSGNTVQHVYGDSLTDLALAMYYPRARDCRACGHLWDQAMRESQAAFRNLMLAHVKKDAS